MRPVETRVSFSPQLFPATAAFAFRCSARETSKSGVEKRDAESVKKRWLADESFTALLIEALREYSIHNDRPIFLVLITSFVSNLTSNH